MSSCVMAAGFFAMLLLRALSSDSFVPGKPSAETQPRPRQLQPAEASAGLGRRALLAAAVPASMTAAQGPAHSAGKFDGFKRIQTQFIAALGDPSASSGTGAGTWGIWRKDPGPRGVQLDNYPRLKAAGGVAPAKWQFDASDWWLEEHGLIMEQPDTPMQPGRYVVTGAREVTTILTVEPSGAWKLDDGKLYDVTHLPCRSARYTGSSCTPESAKQSDFPVTPGGPMPVVQGCNKQDYAVLFVIGVEA